MPILNVKVSGDMLGDLRDKTYCLNRLSRHRKWRNRNSRGQEGLTCLS